MLEAANWAPSHGYTEPWRFTVFTGEARRPLGEAFAEAYRLGTLAQRCNETAVAFMRDRVLLAPVWISIGMTPDVAKNMPEWEEISAVAIAVHNMQLLACTGEERVSEEEQPCREKNPGHGSASARDVGAVTG
jgi:nitroreductase